MKIGHAVRRGLKYLLNSDYRFCIDAGHGKYNHLSDEEYLQRMFSARLGYPLNLENPKTFNEKLQWLKLYDRNPLYTTMVDKYEVKSYIADTLGDEYVIPTLGVWDSFDEINFDELPDQFVLKCTHDSGGLVIVSDKEVFDKKAAKEKIEDCLQRNFYYYGREWPYKGIKPRVIAEKYMGMKGLEEYKFFCFNGKVKVILVCKDTAHGVGRTNDYCDLNFQRLPFTSLNPNSYGDLKKPERINDLITVAEKLAIDIPEVRVDLYITEGQIYFGEMTFFHNSGFCKYDPVEWDGILGDWLQLPKKEEYQNR